MRHHALPRERTHPRLENEPTRGKAEALPRQRTLS